MNSQFNITTWKHNSSVNADTSRQISQINPKYAYDFGAGDGYYGKLIKHLYPNCFVVGVEVEKSYNEKFSLNSYYDIVINETIVTLIESINHS